jgi:trans-2-enoyl-CoA reductase
MSEIKSAWEIALERTRDVKSDKQSIVAHETRQEGQRLASAFLQEEVADLAKELKKYSGDRAGWVREGVYNVAEANLVLPTEGSQASQLLPKVEKLLHAVIKDKRHVSALVQQLQQFFQQYEADRENLRQQLTQQYEPRLRQKEQELAQQVGSQVKLDPMSDPEFAKALRQHMGRLEEQYQSVLTQAKSDLRAMFEGR